MSVSAPVRNKSKKKEIPEVILQAAVPLSEEESNTPTNMQRLNTIPLSPSELPDGMKPASRRLEDQARREEEERIAEVQAKSRSEKQMKLIALGGAIAIGAIIAYKASGYLSPKDIEQIVEEVSDQKQ
jgi:hypothetical protein